MPNLSIYDSQKKAWVTLEDAILHPSDGWYWMNPSWSPWFPNSSQLAFFTAEGLIVSSSDLKQKRVVLRTQEPTGLAVPSPDGRAIAYATFASTPSPNGPGNAPTWNCTGIWVIDLTSTKGPRRLTEPHPALTYDLRWIDNQTLIFDRIVNGIPPKAQIWTVPVTR